MKLLIATLLLFYSIHSLAQKKEAVQDSIPITDSISNRKASTNFYSNSKPQDSLKTKLSDTLRSVFGKVNPLDEVFIDSKSEFDAVSLGILKRKIKPPTPYERQLYTAGDFKPIHLLAILGGTLPVDPIINAITGRTKKLKKYVKIEKKQSNFIFLEDHFTDYMIENLKIEEEMIGRFTNYLVGNEQLQDLIDRRALGELHFLIGDEWLQFKSFQNDLPAEKIPEATKN